ncbi:MAG: hypothetical protein N4A72_03250 [Bacteroidales bacterium]|jgi:hypothetical protein|nr:hypothetical protein [Bacteroidales bacterium]
MSKIKKRDLEDYLAEHDGSLVKLTNGNYDLRGPNGSRNIGKPDSSNKWASAQLVRAWGDATGIPKPDWL